MNDKKICKKCGQPLYVVQPVPPPHYAKYECKNNHWQGWVKKTDIPTNHAKER
jgi:hypothetical protein